VEDKGYPMPNPFKQQNVNFDKRFVIAESHGIINLGIELC